MSKTRVPSSANAPYAYPLNKPTGVGGDKDLVADILKDFETSYKYRLPKERLFREIYRRYRSYLEVTRLSAPTRSVIFVPESFTVVETVAPRMTQRKPSWQVLPRGSSDVSTADSVGRKLAYDYDRSKFHPTLKLFTKQALMYGTSFLKMGWDADRELPTSDCIDIADIFPDPETWDWQDGWIIHRYYLSLAEMKRSTVKYLNLDMLEFREHSVAKDDQMRQERFSTQGIPYFIERTGFEIFERWKRDEDGKVRVQTIADRSVLIRDDDNPYPVDKFPFVVNYDQPVPFERWGIGEIEPILDLQDEENVTRNQRIDEKNLSIHNMWVVSKMAGVDYRNIYSKPGGIILANDINGIKQLEKQNITQESITEIQMIKSDIQNTTGVNDYIRGATQKGDVTASENMSKTQEANVRFSEKVNNLELSIKEVGEWWYAFNAAFMTKSVTVRIDGKTGLEMKKITRKDMQGEYDIDIEVGSSLPANPDLRRQQLTELAKIMIPVLSNPAGIPDGARDLLRTLIQAYDLKNADDILQGTEHPLVNQVMAGLTPDDLKGTNPQMVQQEIKRHLMSKGMMNPAVTPQPGPDGTVQQPPQAEQPAPQQPQNRPPSVSINYQALPPAGQVQAAAQAGIKLRPQDVIQQPSPSNQPLPATIKR